MLTAIILVFCLGYLAITLEHNIKVNKAATALLTGVFIWTIYIFGTPDKHAVEASLAHSLGEFSAVIFFLMGAMTLVELVDLNYGFDFISNAIQTRSKKTLMWIVGFLAFFLSSVLDNLTTTIVCITLLRKLLQDPKERLFYIGIVIIAANAGGAWTPIGDVTTTMLWIGGQLSSGNIMGALFFASMACLLVPVFLASFRVKGHLPAAAVRSHTNHRHGMVFFVLGVLALLLVPVFKIVTHLPPYMGMFFSLGLIWLGMELHDSRRDTSDPNPRTVAHALRKIDVPSLLFFAGILLSVAGLQAVGILGRIADALMASLPNELGIAFIIGLFSAIFDNVPLVAATMGMFDMGTFPMNHNLWEFLAYCAGTGGSILVIGSAAGVAAMGMEKITFFWYLRNISGPALAGYVAGAGVYLAQVALGF